MDSVALSFRKLKNILDRNREQNSTGSGSSEPEIGFRLALHPVSKSLYVTVIGARHLPSLFGFSRAHGYLVKVKLFPGDKKYETTLQETSWPTWNEDFKFCLKIKDDKKKNERLDLQSMVAGHFLSFTIYASLQAPKQDLDKSSASTKKNKNDHVNEQIAAEPKPKDNIISKTLSSFKSSKTEASAQKYLLDKRRTIGAATWNFDVKIFERDLRNGLIGTPEVWRPINAICSGISQQSAREPKKGQLEVTLIYKESQDGLDDIIQLTVNRFRCSVHTMHQHEELKAPLYLKASILEANKADQYWKSERFTPTISARWDPNSSTVKLSTTKTSLDKVNIVISLGCRSSKMSKKEILGRINIGSGTPYASVWNELIKKSGVAKTFWADFE